MLAQWNYFKLQAQDLAVCWLEGYIERYRSRNNGFRNLPWRQVTRQWHVYQIVTVVIQWRTTMWTTDTHTGWTETDRLGLCRPFLQIWLRPKCSRISLLDGFAKCCIQILPCSVLQLVSKNCVVDVAIFSILLNSLLRWDLVIISRLMRSRILNIHRV